MAIKKGIEAGACLWKKVDVRKSRYWNSSTGEYEMREQEYYFVYRLRTRRARSQGDNVNEKLVPFLNSINVITLQWYGDSPIYTAVGVYREHIRTKEEFDAIEIDEVAQKWYDKMKNKEARTILEQPKEDELVRIFELMKEPVEDDTSEVEEWPEEPFIPQYY